MHISYCKFSPRLPLNTHISCTSLDATITSLEAIVYKNSVHSTFPQNLHLSKAKTTLPHTSKACLTTAFNHSVSSSILQTAQKTIPPNLNNSSTLYHDIEPNDLELSLQTQEERPFSELFSISAFNHDIPANDLELSLQAKEEHPFSELLSINTLNHDTPPNDLELSLQAEEEHPFSELLSISTLNHDIPPNDLELSLQAEEERPFSELFNLSTSHPDIRTNALDLSLQVKERSPSFKLTCQLCSKNHVQLIQLLVEGSSNSSYTYSIGAVHAPLQEWLFYKALINSNQKNPITLFQCLIASKEKPSSFYTSSNSTSIAYMASQISDSKKEELIDILSIYLGENLLEIYQKTSTYQNELKAITQTIEASALSNAFNILITLKTYTLLPRSDYRYCKESPAIAPSIINASNTPEVIPQIIQTPASSSKSSPALKTPTLPPISNCPYCKEMQAIVPSIMKSSEEYYSAIKPLQERIKLCEQEHKNKHKLYIELQWDNTHTVTYIKDKKITIMIALIDTPSFNSLLLTKKSYVGYYAQYHILKELQGEKSKSSDLVIDFSKIQSYIRSIPSKNLPIVANNFKIFIGITLVDTSIPKALLQAQANLSTSAKPRNIRLYESLSVMMKARCLWNTLTSIHDTLKTKRDTPDAPPCDTQTKQHHPNFLLQVIWSYPIGMRRITKIVSSSYPFTGTFPRSFSASDLKKQYTLLCENNKWPKSNLQTRDEVIYTLCIPWKMVLDKNGGLSIDLADTSLSIIALNINFITLWNRLHRKIIYETHTNYTQEILNFFFAEKDSFSVSNNDEIETTISQNQKSFTCQIKYLLGAKLANLLHFELSQKKIEDESSSSDYFNLKSMSSLSKSLLDNTFNETLESDAKIFLNAIVVRLTKSLPSCCLAFILDQGKAPSNQQLQMLDTLRITKRKSEKQSNDSLLAKRKKTDSKQ